MVDIEDGKYLLEIHPMPDDPTGTKSLETMDHTPIISQEIEGKGGDIELEIDIKKQKIREK